MITIVEGNALDFKETVLIHQVNCLGYMGAGIAKSIRTKWPSVYDAYREAVIEVNDPRDLLGKSLVVGVGDQYVANLFSQNGLASRGEVATDYQALKIGLGNLIKYAPNSTYAMPYKMGCGLGGGDWNEVYPILEDIFKTTNLFIYKL